MRTDPPARAAAERRRVALVLARYDASAAAPPGVDPVELGQAALADSYEVLADLVDVTSGIAGLAEHAELLWPGDRLLPDVPVLELAALVGGDPPAGDAGDAAADELVVVPADAPDLPGLVLAKVFKVLHRADVVVAPEVGGSGCVALGVRLPVAPWLLTQPLDLDTDPYERLAAAAPSPDRVGRTPGWHRLRTAGATERLDPGLEGWEETRALLAARSPAGRGVR